MNILVVRTDKLGDFITALPTMYVLKHYNPQNRIIACVAPLNEALARECDFIDEVIVDKGQSLLKLASQLRKAKVAVSITLFSNTRVAMAQFLAGIPKRIAPATKIAQIFYTTRIKQRRSEVKMAEFEYNLELTKSFANDIDLNFPKPLLTFNAQEVVNVYEIFRDKYQISRPIIAFHPGFGGSSDANLSMKEYIELIEIVLRKEQYQVVMTFGPGDENFLEQAKALTVGMDIILYESKEGIIPFAKLIRSFKLFVSTSTGTYHLAALVGTPTLTFFADSLFASVKRWKAVSDETMQHPFMLPFQSDKRASVFNDIKDFLEALKLQN